MELLLTHGCTGAVNVPNRKCLANSGGCDTPLTIAADDGLLSVCRLLLNHRADVAFRCMNEMTDGHGFTPLLYAAKNAAFNSGQGNQSALCQLLLQHDADCNAQDAKGFTPLMWTVPEKGRPTGQMDVARVLLQFGAIIDMTDKEGLSALWWACKFCESMFLENPSVFPNDQHPAALPPCAPYILLLLDHGAVANLRPKPDVASPEEMLARCGLRKLLEKEVVVVSDDSDDPKDSSDSSDFELASKRIRPTVFKRLGFPCKQQQQQQQQSSSDDLDDDVQRQLQDRKKTLKMKCDELRKELKKAEEDLEEVKTQLRQGFGNFDLVVKLESNDEPLDPRDRWSRYCDKCGQMGTLLCCEHPGCKLAFHAQCVFLNDIPQGTWVCGNHGRSADLARDSNSMLRALLWKPKTTDVSTVWRTQRCFAENVFQILDTSNDEFLAKAQARVFSWFDANCAAQSPVCVVKGLPNGCDAATQRGIEAALMKAFENPNSLSSPSRATVMTIPETDDRVGLRGQSGLLAAVGIPKFTVLEAYRGRLRVRQQAAQSPSLMDKWVRAIYEYDITDDSWSHVKPNWWQFVRNALCIDAIQEAEGLPGFANEFMLMNDFRREDPVKVSST